MNYSIFFQKIHIKSCNEDKKRKMTVNEEKIEIFI